VCLGFNLKTSSKWEDQKHLCEIKFKESRNNNDLKIFLGTFSKPLIIIKVLENNGNQKKMGVYSNHLYLESYPSPMIFEISYVQMHIKDSYSNTSLDQ
jgi:hypothetical protein